MERISPSVMFCRRLGMVHIKAPRVMGCKWHQRLAPELASDVSMQASMQTNRSGSSDLPAPIDPV
jgi:hypothetical protein